MRTAHLVGGVIGIVAVTACYRPAAFDDACAITCSPDVGCPDGATCTDGRCGTGCTTVVDASVVETDAPPGTEECFGQDLVRVCLSTIRPSLTLPSDLSLDALIETPSGCDYLLPQPADLPAACVIAARRVTITGRVRFGGIHPVVLVGAETVQITSVVDLSQGGAGSRPTAACPPSDAPPSGGGAGGSFGTAGGAGGTSAGGTAGAHAPVPLAAVRGGCDGHRGGADGLANPGPFGGRGGGAIWVIAGASIQLTSTIHANGGGGGGAMGGGAGGGGGASGGLIVLEAPVVSLGTGAVVVANGGGGGGGGGGTVTQTSGMPGEPGNLAGTPAAGGGGGTAGGGVDVGRGGRGSPAATAGAASASGVGGGGGGGGEGRIRFLGMWNGAGLVSPSALSASRHAR